MATNASPSSDIRVVVQKARDELSGVIADITKVLMTVAVCFSLIPILYLKSTNNNYVGCRRRHGKNCKRSRC